MSPIPVNIPVLEGNEAKYVLQAVETGWISSEGPFVKEFESKLLIATGVNMELPSAMVLPPCKLQWTLWI